MCGRNQKTLHSNIGFSEMHASGDSLNCVDDAGQRPRPRWMVVTGSLSRRRFAFRHYGNDLILGKILPPKAGNTERMRKWKSVILDYGMVLCRAPEPDAIAQMCEVFSVDGPTFWQIYDRDRLLYDRGGMTSKEYWHKFAGHAAAKIDEGQLQWLRKFDIEMFSVMDDALLQWAQDLRSAGYKTAILSNLNQEFTAHMRAKCDWIKRFDLQVFSSEVGLTKPNPEIYRHTLRALETDPSEAIFVDDRAANVDAAAEIGITTVKYESRDQLRKEMEKLHFDVLPAREFN
jgi:putative hydrolase of the HAD superfamily